MTRRWWMASVVVLVACSGCTDERRKTRPSEPEVQLDRLAKMAKVYLAKHAEFPTGSAPLTPACCERPGHTCAPDPAMWTGVWEQLDFTIEDGIKFRYAYDGTATSFTARAVGDLDCDFQTIEYTAIGTAENGEPRVVFASSGTD